MSTATHHPTHICPDLPIPECEGCGDVARIITDEGPFCSQSCADVLARWKADHAIEAVTLPMAGYGETITIHGVPTRWVPLLVELGSAGAFSYGPNYSRQSAENLRDMARMLSFSDMEAASHWYDRIVRRHTAEVA